MNKMAAIKPTTGGVKSERLTLLDGADAVNPGKSAAPPATAASPNLLQ